MPFGHSMRFIPIGDFTSDLLPDLMKNYEGWEQGHFDPAVGLFWQTGHDDGMEININSRQTQDTVRGAPGYRPTLNSYLWADASAIARIATRGQERHCRNLSRQGRRTQGQSAKEALGPEAGVLPADV